MKRTVIGSVFALTGTAWTLFVLVAAENRLVSSWPDFPGRFLTTIFESGLALPALLGAGLLVCGLLILAVEYFKK